MKYRIREYDDEHRLNYDDEYNTIPEALETITEYIAEDMAGAMSGEPRFMDYQVIDEDGDAVDIRPLIYADTDEIAAMLNEDPAFLAAAKMILPGCSAGIDTDPDPLYRLYLLAGDLQANYLLAGYYYDGSRGRVIKA